MEWLAESGLKAKWRIAFGKHKGRDIESASICERALGSTYT